jgi:fructose 1,6-bisphosphate aldolase/phosphatase
MFDDPAFDRVRNRCNELADTMRAQGPFEPHRIAEEMEQPPLTRVEQELSKRWEPLPP